MPAWRAAVLGVAAAEALLGFRTLLGSGALAAQISAAQAQQVAGARAETALAEANRLMDAGQFDRAAAVLSGLVSEQPGSAAGHRMLAYSYLRLDDPKRSLAEYTRAAAIERPSAVDLQNVAKDYVLLGDTASAAHWLTVSLEENARDPESWYSLGRVRYTEQHFQEAAECFRRSLALLPRSVKAENNLGLALEGLNRTDEAVAAYRQAILWQEGEAHPSEQPLLNLGTVLVHQGSLDEARRLLKQAAAIAPLDPRVHEQLGHLYLQMPKLAEAQAEFEEAVRLEPKNAALHFLLGKVYRQQGRAEKAKAEFEESARLSGERATPERF